MLFSKSGKAVAHDDSIIVRQKAKTSLYAATKHFSEQEEKPLRSLPFCLYSFTIYCLTLKKNHTLKVLAAL